MINLPTSGNRKGVAGSNLSSPLLSDGAAPEPSRPQEASSSAPCSILALVRNHYDYVWRVVRRLGVRESDADDATQQVFFVAARKVTSIRLGSERAFLVQTAVRVAATQRRTYARRRDASGPVIDADDVPDVGPSTDELVAMRRAREQLDHILDNMPLELRAVFVLHELEEESVANIAVTLNIPAGTAASRLRRARAIFIETVARDFPPGRSAP